MDFVQRAKALIKSTAKSGTLKILPLAAAAAMSMNAASFDPGSAISLCTGDTLQFAATSTVGGVTGIKMFNSSGSCTAAGNGSVFLAAGGLGFGSGTFDAALEQLEVTFEFTGSALISGSPTDYEWSLAVDINNGGAIGDLSNMVANHGELVSSSDVGPLIIDMTGVAGQLFTQWSVILTLTRSDTEETTPISLGLQIPQNSIDVNGVAPTVDPIPEPGTVMLMIAGGMAFLVRRRMK